MKHKTNLKKTVAVLLSMLLIFSLTACSGQKDDQGTNLSAGASGDGASNPSNGESGNNTDGTSENILIVYFSHTGENYSVGVIEKGNTHIIADMIAEETGADMFEIQPVIPYPGKYDECTDVAKREQNNHARPEFIGGVENMEQYDTIFIGYPIWWGDLPMVVYTFLESYDFSGKTIIPFCTHEGSGLAGTDRSIKNSCPDASVRSGLAIRGSTAQNKQDDAKSDVLKWLRGLGY